MAKSKNHTSHNQSNKAHKNGAWRAPWPKTDAPCRCTALRCTPAAARLVPVGAQQFTGSRRHCSGL